MRVRPDRGRGGRTGRWAVGAAIAVWVALSAPGLAVGVPTLGTLPAERPVPSVGATDTVLATVAVGTAPAEPTFDPATGDLYVPESGGELAVLSAGPDPQLVANVSVAPAGSVTTPLYVAIDRSLYVPFASAGTGGVAVVSGSPGSVVAEIATGAGSRPATPAFDPDDGELYIPDQGTDALTIANVSTGQVVATVAVGAGPTTPALDAAVGELYVPNGGSDNLSIVATATDSVTATIGGLWGPSTPAYDPVNGLVYVPNGNASNLTVLSGTDRLAPIEVGAGPETPAVDNTSGTLYVPNGANTTVSVVSPTTGEVEATVTTGAGPTPPVVDPANGEVYVADAVDGSVAAISTAADRAIAIIGAGADCDPAVLDPATDQLFVANFATNNVTVIAAGPANASTAPGTFSVAFTASGAPAGAAWEVSMEGTRFNSTAATIPFFDLSNGSYDYAIAPPAGFYVAAPVAAGRLTVDGADRTVAVTFAPLSGSGPPTSAPEFLGLPGEEGYLLVVAGLVVVAVVVTLGFAGRRGPPEPPPPDGPVPPGR